MWPSECGLSLLFALCAVILSTVVKCGVLQDQKNCRPEQVHIAFGDTTSEMVVQWVTDGNCSSAVQYGTRPWDFSQSASGETKYFNHTDDHSSFYHRVKLKDLQSTTTYFYRPISNNISSGPFYFEVPPQGEEWQPVFMVCGNIGTHVETIPSVTTEVLKGTYTAMLHVGDFAYTLHEDMDVKEENESTSHEKKREQGFTESPDSKVADTIMRLTEDIASHIPFMTSPGNHELNASSEAASHYRYLFSMPKSDWPIPNNKMWYSIDIGPVHFISYSSEVFFTGDNTVVEYQRQWLKSDLDMANQNRQKRPWVIAFGHRPMYYSDSEDDPATKKSSSVVRTGLEDVFYNYGVDVVIQVHGHSYERLWPQYKGVVLSKDYTNPKAPVQFITGAAERMHSENAMGSANKTAAWVAFRGGNESKHSYGRLKVYNSSHISWEQVGVFTGDVIDSVWISQQTHGPFTEEKLSNDIKQKIDDNKADMTSHSHKQDTVSVEQVSHTLPIDFSETKTRIALGASIGGLLLIIIVIVFVTKKCRRKGSSNRRWDSLDYGRKFYSNVKDNDKDTDDDFEVDVRDGTQTTKLLSSDP